MTSQDDKTASVANLACLENVAGLSSSPEEDPEYLEYLHLKEVVFSDDKRRKALLRKLDFRVLFPLTVRPLFPLASITPVEADALAV